jgi:hypothetical protein
MARPQRPVPVRPSRRSLLVFTEGKVTEEVYLNFYRRRHRGVNVTVDRFHGPPLSLVERAVSVKKNEEREERRKRTWAPDEIWCVFDVDTHPRIEEATALAAEDGIKVAISSPCIELWFVLHFDDQTAHLDARSAQRRAAEYLSAGKRLTDADLDALVGRYGDAKARALSLAQKHRLDARQGPGNPSSEVWRLIDSIAAASSPNR